MTFPVKANTLVPFEFFVPIEANHSPPLFIIAVIFAKVSTLFITVGQPNNPFTTGKGGRGLGVPLLPSIDAKSAVSSPHTKAPAPSLISKSNEKSLPKIFFPNNP